MDLSEKKFIFLEISIKWTHFKESRHLWGETPSMSAYRLEMHLGFLGKKHLCHTKDGRSNLNSSIFHDRNPLIIFNASYFNYTYLKSRILWSNRERFDSGGHQWLMTLLSMKETNICVSKNRHKKGRCWRGWSERNAALSNMCKDSRFVNHSSIS